MSVTNLQFDKVITVCRNIFVAKMKDYGASWRIFRPQSVTDQIFIKAKRIRSIEITGVSLVGDDIAGEYRAIVNYGIIALIQVESGCADDVDLSAEDAQLLYDKYAAAARHLLQAKNHDYGEAWRGMRMESYTDMILSKINRIKTIEENGGRTEASEGIESNYYDIINYAVFGLIKIMEREEK